MHDSQDKQPEGQAVAYQVCVVCQRQDHIPAWYRQGLKPAACTQLGLQSDASLGTYSVATSFLASTASVVVGSSSCRCTHWFAQDQC